MHNPALYEIPRNRPAPVIPPQRNASILDWLEGTGRLLERDTVSFDYRDDEEEINELMAGEDNSFEPDDDDDDALELDD
jgi:Protein of unknown function (DUF3134)